MQKAENIKQSMDKVQKLVADLPAATDKAATVDAIMTELKFCAQSSDVLNSLEASSDSKKRDAADTLRESHNGLIKIGEQFRVDDDLSKVLPLFWASTLALPEVELAVGESTLSLANFLVSLRMQGLVSPCCTQVQITSYQ